MAQEGRKRIVDDAMTISVNGGVAMSGKMLEKIHYRRSARWRTKQRIKESLERTMAAARAFLVPIEDKKVILKYDRLRVSNYKLLIVLYLLVALTCSVTNSPWVLLFSAIWFYLLLTVHHISDVKAHDGCVFSSDYQFTNLLMSMYSFAGFMTAITVVASLFVTI